MWVVDLLHIPFGCSVRVLSSRRNAAIFIGVTSRSGLRFGRRALYGQVCVERPYILNVSKSKILVRGVKDDGEIDIIEAINLASNNQYALHTLPGCTLAPGSAQSGHPTATNCSEGSGCVVVEAAPNSYNEGFAQAGGGVWATQFDTAGILCVGFTLPVFHHHLI